MLQLSPCTSSALFVSQPGPQDLGSAPVGCWASCQGLRAAKGWSAQSRRDGAELELKNPHPNLPLGCCQALMSKWLLFYFCFQAPHLGICQKLDLSLTQTAPLLTGLSCEVTKPRTTLGADIPLHLRSIFSALGYLQFRTKLHLGEIRSSSSHFQLCQHITFNHHFLSKPRCYIIFI